MDSIGDRTEQTDDSTARSSEASDAESGLLLPNQVRPEPAGTGPEPSGTGSPSTVQDGPPPNLAKWLTIYTLLRLGMLVVLAGVLSLLMPLILALLFAVVLALPLAWLLFGGVRTRVNQALAHSNAVRRAERERLRSALNGDDLR